MRIFPDANVLVANFLWDGLCARIMEAVTARPDDELVLAGWVLEETARTLREKFEVPPVLIDEYLDILKGLPSATPQQTPLALSPYRVSDPDDRVVLACALTARADVLLSGDKALLDVAAQVWQNEGMRILHPAAFWEFLSAE